jgi:small GTP-binding protein
VPELKRPFILMLGNPFDFSLKIVVVGESSTGKTSLLYRFVADGFADERNPTLCVDFSSQIVVTAAHQIQLQFWDTAGQEIYRSIARHYFRRAAGALVVFDLTQEDSFNKVGEWIRILTEDVGPDISLVLIGNKTDLAAERAITYETASEFADERRIRYIETSAKTGENVKNAVHALALLIEERVEAGTFNPNEDDGTAGAGDVLEQKDSGCC